MKQALGIIFCLFLLLLVCTGTMAEELKLPQNLKTVADDAFLGDQSVTAVVFPDGLEAIGKNAFANTGLTAVTIPASVTQIGEKAFAGCKGLIITCERGSAAEAYAIANDIPCVFMDESPLSDFIFTPLSNSTCSVTGYIGSEAVVVIPSRDEAGRRVDNIGDSAFSECDSLVSVTIPYGVTSLTCYAFYGCKNLTSINIPSSMTDIDNYVFCDAAITSVSIPASVRYIGEGAFAGCEKLTHIDVSAKNKDYASRDGILYNKYFQTILNH